MNIRLTLRVLGGLLILLGVTFLAPLPFCLHDHDGRWPAFAFSALVTCGTGLVLRHRFRPTPDRGHQEVTLREGFAIASFAWVGFALFGSLPYLASGSLRNPADAFFESVSGFTTCGASVFTNVEANPRSLLFYRSLTQWIGGMGFIVLTVGFLPLFGVGAMRLFEAEAAGPPTERLTPRIQDTARLLWAVYALLTAAGIGLLWAGEMDFFDATCHTFCAISTGGFSTRNVSVGAFGTYSQCVIIALMIAGTTSFSLHYFAVRGQIRRYWTNSEFRFYLAFFTAVTLFLVVANWRLYDDPLLNLRDTAFNAASILSTSGFATADYEKWPIVSQWVLFIAMFAGGCAGSTAGGIKQVRVVLLLKHALQQTARLIHPRQVQVLKIDGRKASPDVIQEVFGFAVLFLATFAAGSLLLTAAGVDLVTAASGTIACLSTVGPGLAEVGPLDNFAALPGFAKLVLSIIMILGRLEISTVLVLCFASFWKK